jgi:uncharacterized membrane protein YfcA
MSTATIFTCLAIGIVSGVIAALCGVGGGVVMVPAFVFFLKLPQKTAVATSLAIIIPTALMATTQNARSGFVDWKVAAITAISASIFAYFGAGWLKTMSNETLTRIFGTVLVVFGLRMLMARQGVKQKA